MTDIKSIIKVSTLISIFCKWFTEKEVVDYLRVIFCIERADESISVRHDTDLNNVGKSGQPSSKGNRTQHGMVSSLATSKNKNAYTTAVSHRDGETRAAAEAQKGVAVAEADTKQGPQSLAAARGNTAFAEAKSGGTGDAMSLAVASGGPAQSSAQSRGGFMEAKAIQVQGGAVSANPKLKYADIDGKNCSFVPRYHLIEELLN